MNSLWALRTSGMHKVEWSIIQKIMQTAAAEEHQEEAEIFFIIKSWESLSIIFLLFILIYLFHSSFRFEMKPNSKLIQYFLFFCRYEKTLMERDSICSKSINFFSFSNLIFYCRSGSIQHNGRFESFGRIMLIYPIFYTRCNFSKSFILLLYGSINIWKSYVCFLSNLTGLNIRP